MGFSKIQTYGLCLMSKDKWREEKGNDSSSSIGQDPRAGNWPRWRAKVRFPYPWKELEAKTGD